MQLVVESWEQREKVDILSWVQDNLSKIRGHARKYLTYTPYEPEEFIQAAYEAALLAQNDESHEFKQSFWFHFKKACLNMTYSKGDKAIPCYHEEYIEFGSDDSPPTCISIQPAIDDTPTHQLSPNLEDSLISTALQEMTAKEREVWELLLLGMSLKKVAAILGKSKTAVIKLRESGKNRVKPIQKK